MENNQWKISTSEQVRAVSFRVPQGFILSPVLFNIYKCDMFYEIGDLDIASYDDNDAPDALNK